MELLKKNNPLNTFNKDLNKKENIIINKNNKKRNTRILGMYAIIINHILAHGKVLKKYRHRIFVILLILCQWHISLFTLISGIIGYNKYINYYNLFYLWLTVLFYSVIIYLIFKVYKLKNLDEDIFSYLFPVISGKYWYFTKYFGMYLLLPIINKGILYTNESELRIIVFSTIGIFVIWGDLINQREDPFLLNSGRSTLWFVVFYITGTYVGKYKLRNNIKKKSSFFIYLIIFICTNFISYYFSTDKLRDIRIKLLLKIKILFHYRNNSITSIVQAISLTLFLCQIKFNNLTERIITFFGPFTFSVYLIHEHKLIRKYIINNLFVKDSKELSKNIILCLIFN